MKKIMSYLATLSVGVLVGLVVAKIIFYTLPTHRINVAMEACDYDPHPISDIAWELYARSGDRYRLGAAYYYTWMLKSSNGKAAKCMIKLLDPIYYEHQGYGGSH